MQKDKGVLSYHAPYLLDGAVYGAHRGKSYEREEEAYPDAPHMVRHFLDGDHPQAFKRRSFSP